MYNVTITYAGVSRDPEQIATPVMRIYKWDTSYVDSPGLAGTVYDTNVEGWGTIDQVEPFATTSIPFPVPLAQFKLAMVGANNSVTFQVDDYKEAFYYMQVGVAMADQGFTVEVAPVED